MEMYILFWHTGFFEMCCEGHCRTAATNGITPAGPVSCMGVLLKVHF